MYHDNGRAQLGRDLWHVQIPKEVPVSRLADDDALVDSDVFWMP